VENLSYAYVFERHVLPMAMLLHLPKLLNIYQSHMKKSVEPQITTTCARISAWAYLKVVSSSTLLHYLW